MTKILMIEDDLELAEILTEYLEQFEFEVITEDDPFKAVSILKLESFDLVILDLTLPGMDGLEVCEAIRERQDVPIIISSARSDVTDKIKALELGADDYMPKPYDPRELVTRIKTILRRTHSVSNEKKKEDEIFVADIKAHTISFRDTFLDLTAAEYDILAMLIQHKNGSVSREQLLYESEHIDDDSSIKNIDVMISRIRQKLAKVDPDNIYIKPIRGVGYLLTDRV